MRKTFRFIGFSFGIGLLMLAGCGYQLVGGTAGRPSDIHSLAIPIFSNRTIEEGIEREITRALVEKFTSAKRIPVMGEEGADSILWGTVRSFSSSPIIVTLQTQTVTEYRATLTIEFVVKKGKDGKVLRKGEMSEWRNYPVSANLAATENSKKEAIRQISVLLAERIHEAILSDF